jgi:hypothetical protein
MEKLLFDKRKKKKTNTVKNKLKRWNRTQIEFYGDLSNYHIIII